MATNQTPVNDAELRSFCARILGWADEQKGAVEHALRLIELAATHRAALVLLGETDLVPIAQALHRRTLGAEQPFIVCDPKRQSLPTSVRSPENRGQGVTALVAARSGSLCVHSSRLPHDFSSVVTRMRNPNTSVQLIVCADGSFDANPFLVLPAPILVPSLITRASELSRIVDEYTFDALEALGAPDACFTDDDHAWVLEHSSLTLPEIEKATLRIVALRMSRSLSHAAERLGMAPVSLTRWLRRRKLPNLAGGGT